MDKYSALVQLVAGHQNRRQTIPWPTIARLTGAYKRNQTEICYTFIFCGAMWLPAWIELRNISGLYHHIIIMTIIVTIIIISPYHYHLNLHAVL